MSFTVLSIIQGIFHFHKQTQQTHYLSRNQSEQSSTKYRTGILALTMCGLVYFFGIKDSAHSGGFRVLISKVIFYTLTQLLLNTINCVSLKMLKFSLSAALNLHDTASDFEDISTPYLITTGLGCTGLLTIAYCSLLAPSRDTTNRESVAVMALAVITSVVAYLFSHGLTLRLEESNQRKADIAHTSGMTISP
jgi:hypothetical protein